MYFQSNLSGDSLLDRIENSGYNYAAVSLVFRISNASVGDGDIYANLRSDVCTLAVALAARNIRLIPLIPMSSKWALQWKLLQLYENPKIGMNTIVADNDLPVILGDNPICQYTGRIENATMGSNSWAFEPEGVDKSMIDVFTAIRDGFSDADVDFPLEYIHIQHDEPQFLNWLLMAGAGARCGNASPYRGNFARAEISAADSQYIDSLLHEGISAEKAYQRLLADELYRRVTQADEVFGPGVNLMFYAESFDDQSWGGVPWRVNLDDTARILMHGVIDLPGLDEQKKKTVKERTVAMVWNFDGKQAFVNSLLGWIARTDYNSEAVFKRFSDHGFNFMYIGALQNGDASKNQIAEYAAAARIYPDNCLGYYGAAWDVVYDPADPDPKWDIIEYLPSIQKSTSFEPQQPAPPVISASLTGGSASSPLTLTFNLARRERVAVTLFTSDGRRMGTPLDAILVAGTYTYRWKYPPGLCMVKFRAGSEVTVMQVPVVR